MSCATFLNENVVGKGKKEGKRDTLLGFLFLSRETQKMNNKKFGAKVMNLKDQTRSI